MSSVAQDVAFDLLVSGGEVLDPATGIQGRYDIGIVGGKIARIEPHIPVGLATEVLDATGTTIVPGLVDLHTHIAFLDTFWGIDPRPVAWRSGVTNWVDAGSTGAYSTMGLQELASRFSPLRTKAFINISAIGLIAETGEARRPELCDPELCASAIQRSNDFIVGIKCRMDRFATGQAGIGPLQHALTAAERLDIPVMVHIGAGPPLVQQVLDLLRPGDIVTHCTTGQSMALIDKTGALLPEVVSARQRGVLFDVGHGSGAFSFDVAQTMLDVGHAPDVISSDLHQRSVAGPAFDLPTCMSKFLALGMPLADIVRSVTATPAQAIGLGDDWGALAIGRRADLAIFALEEGDFRLYDSYLRSRRTHRLFVNRATVAAGKILPPLAPDPSPPWIELTDLQSSFLRSDAEHLRNPWAMTLDTVHAFTRQSLEGPPITTARSQ